ncbi:MAG: DUF2066 domain-containing protein [Halioglobus sp.]|nr:DUF2066 domain-containing protein [Halioglobus sp.]
MKKTCVALIWAWLVLASAQAAVADVVPDLYAASVPVTEQSSTVLDAASKEAMAEVLVKVSGSKNVLQYPSIAAALKDARSHVQQYSYVRGKPPAPPLSLRFEFDGNYITELVTDSGAPLWTANRPAVLAWVVIEDEQGRHFINQETSPDEAQWLVEAFARRGVPVQIPVFDLTDTAAISTDDVWSLDAFAIQGASGRYNVQEVVAGRLAVSDTGQSPGDWSYFRQGERINRSVTVPDLPAFLSSGVNIVAADMASRYAVAPTSGSGGGLSLAITGVTNYSDYAAIANWLQKLELVDYVNLERVQGERIEFRVQAKTDAAQLAAIIDLNDRLTPVPTLGDTQQLSYQWR